MPDVLHSATTYVHQPWDSRLEYNSYADLKAGAGVTAAMVGKLAKLNSDGSMWEVLNHNPPKFRLAIGEDVSRGDETFILDSVGGNDTTGIGTVSNPFKTFDEAFEHVPKLIKDHTIRIKPKAGTYTSFPKTVEINTAGTGRLIIDASAETYVENAIGELTLTSAAGIGNNGGLGYPLATQLNVSGASWTVDEFYGSYIWPTSGNWQNYILDIHSNGTNYLKIGVDWYGFAPGDTFKIVTEPVVIDVSHSIHFRGNSAMQYFTSGTSIVTPYKPSFLTCGIRFKSDVIHPFQFENLTMTRSFSTLWGESSNSSSINGQAFNCDLSFSEIPAGSFDVTELEDWYAFGNLSIPLNGVPPTTNIICWLLQNTNISQEGCRGSFRWEGTSGKSSSFGSKASKVEILGQSQTVLEYIYLEQIGWDSPAIVCDRGNVDVLSVQSTHNEGFISLANNGTANVTWLQGTDPLAGSYAADLRLGSKIFVVNSANVTAMGAAGAIKFQRFGANTATRANWPTNGNAFDDRDASGQGATCFVVTDNI